jgi:hypothetical protein
VAGAAFGAALGAAVFLLATLLHDRLSGRGEPGAPPPRFGFGSAARAPVRVLATLGGEPVRAVLLPLREDGGAAEAVEALLDGDLFPGGPPRRWARLLVANPAGGKPWRLGLGPGEIVLERGGAGALANEDLPAAFAARADSLSPHRALDLRTFHADDAALEIPPGEFRRVLVAFPRAADPAAAEGAVLSGGLRLLPREVSVESLRSALTDGKVEALVDAARAEAPARDPDEGPK